jgi:hypothetical protein
MTTFRTHFTFRVDTWTPDGESIVEHVAGIEDYQVALATYRAACERWPGTPITLRHGARVIEDSRRRGVIPSERGTFRQEPLARLMSCQDGALIQRAKITRDFSASDRARNKGSRDPVRGTHTPGGVLVCYATERALGHGAYGGGLYS